MNLRHLGFVTLISLAAFGCSSGSTERQSTPNCQSDSKFCLISCNLGCSLEGTCSISEIAQNQPISLVFSDLLDPASVTAGAVSLKTPNGESPAGSFLVSGSTLQFVPETRITGGVTRFGFRTGETYILTLTSEATGPTLRSSSGDRLARAVVCSLSVTQGLVDLDGQAPVAELVTPAETEDVPVNTQIIVRFSELIDTTRFQGGSTATSPIVYQIRKTTTDPNDPSKIICNPQFKPVLIQGVPVASVLGTVPPRTEISLQPSIELPAGVCVEVIVTDQVRDLAGRPAERTVFQFFTDIGNPQPRTLTETFATESGMDRTVSGGTWAAGRAVPARFGGSGILGSFDYSVGRNEPSGSANWIFNTDSQSFPADRTLFGTVEQVVGGVFDFTDFVVPSGVRVVFRGSRPAVVRVRGICRIDGVVTTDGVSPSSAFVAKGTAGPVGQVGPPVTGELGSAGGAGGGGGGHGGQSCLGAGLAGSQTIVDVSGENGDDCGAPAGSGYFGAVAGSGGVGGGVFPVTGDRAQVVFNLFFSITGQVSPGGGGGSFLGAGTQGVVLATFTGNNPLDIGIGSLPGTVVPFVPRPNGVSSLDHFLVGGGGGGGGGSHPLNMTSTDVNGSPTVGRKPWHAGCAGGGGGGAFALRLGVDCLVGATGQLTSRGGGGASYTANATTVGPGAPGGGGAGGSILIQIDNSQRMDQAGRIDVSGGLGTIVNHSQFNGQSVNAHAGNGGHGFVRLEATAPTLAQLGTVVGPPSLGADNVGTLDPTDRDTRTGCTSTWRSTRQLFPPPFLYYRMTVLDTSNNQTTVYSDDPDNFNPANSDLVPVRVYVQGGTVNSATNQLEGEPGPWRDFISGSNGQQSINNDSANGFRFMMIFNRDVSSTIVVTEFQVVYQA